MNLLFKLAMSVLFSHNCFGYDGIKLVRELGIRFCPYTSFCYTNASLSSPIGNSLVPCCLPCSCDDECWALGNCCPDKEETTDEFSTLPCKTVEVKWSSNSVESHRGYRIVDFCPSSETDVELLMKCGGENRVDLEDYIWVSDLTSGIIYQNIHCIKCHGIQEYITWMIKATCGDVLDDDIADIPEILLSDSCNIINIVPEEIRPLSQKYRCVAGAQKCDSPPGEDVIEQDVFDACLKSSWAYISWSPFKTTVYGNVFCYACQKGLGRDLSTACPADDFDELLDDSTKGSANKFSVIINYRERPKQTELEKVDVCRYNQIRDPFTNKCYDLLCTFGHYPWYGTCEKTYSAVFKASLCAKYVIHVDWNDTLLASIDHTARVEYLRGSKKNIYKFILEMAAFDKLNCSFRYINKTVSEDGPTSTMFVLLFTIDISVGCNLYEASTSTLALTGPKSLENTNGETLNIVVKLLKRFDYFDEDFECWTENILSEPNIPGFGGLTETRMLRLENDRECSQITLSYEDKESFSDAQRKQKQVFLSFFESVMSNKMTTVNVCLDDYFRKMNDVNSATTVKGYLLLICALYMSLVGESFDGWG